MVDGEQGERDAIGFECVVAKVQTLADGGLRVWLDLPETATLAAAQLMAAQVHGAYLKAKLTPERVGDERARTPGRRSAKRRNG